METSTKNQFKEIEARFLEIDREGLTSRLRDLNAEDRGEELLNEVIFYDAAFKWRDSEGKYVRLRTDGQGTKVTYKHHKEAIADGTEEIEFSVPDAATAEKFLTQIGLVAARQQQKKRHSFYLNGVTADIDTWPGVPTYVELEGPSEEALKEAAAKLGFKWSDAVFQDARTIIEKRYKIPVGSLKFFTFDRQE